MEFTLKTLQAKAKELLQSTTQATDKAATVVAQKCTELTGRPTTANEVKKVSVCMGAVAVIATGGGPFLMVLNQLQRAQRASIGRESATAG